VSSNYPSRGNGGQRNGQASREENKDGGVLMDFSGDFTSGSGNQPVRPPPLASRRGLPNKPKLSSSRTSKPTENRKFGTPVVKMTRAMQMRQEANKRKIMQNNGKTGKLSTIREQP
jgi:hypothetical protein